VDDGRDVETVERGRCKYLRGVVGAGIGATIRDDPGGGSDSIDASHVEQRAGDAVYQYVLSRGPMETTGITSVYIDGNRGSRGSIISLAMESLDFVSRCGERL